MAALYYELCVDDVDGKFNSNFMSFDLHVVEHLQLRRIGELIMSM